MGRDLATVIRVLSLERIAERTILIGFVSSKNKLLLCTFGESPDKTILRDVQTDMYYFENAVGRRIQKGPRGTNERPMWDVEYFKMSSQSSETFTEAEKGDHYESDSSPCETVCMQVFSIDCD